MFPIQLSLVLLSLAVSSASLSSARAELSSDSLKQARSLVERVNSAGAGWTAELYPRFAGMTKAQFRSMNGIHVPEHLVGVRPKQLEKAPTSVADPSIPEEFDSRTHWPNCADVVNHIRDQSRCGSCWAVSAAGAFSDRICITTNGRTKVSVSSIDVASCAKFGRDGCQGSDSLVRAWDYFFHTGAVTGSGWHEQQGCKPYPFPLSAKATRDFRSPRCSHRCQKGYTGGTYEQEKFRVYAPTAINGGSSAERARLLQQELMAHGSVPVAFIVYGDFSSYKSGVYRHVTGEPTGGHAVRLVGWGVDKGSGTPYWLVANSWGPDWGEKGFFRIRRGTDECFIESMMVPYAGVPIGLDNDKGNATST